MLNADYPGQFCSIAKSLEVVGERWSLLIVRDILNGNRRFGEIQRSLGVARNVLSARLQRLIDDVAHAPIGSGSLHLDGAVELGREIDGHLHARQHTSMLGCCKSGGRLDCRVDA